MVPPLKLTEPLIWLAVPPAQVVAAVEPTVVTPAGSVSVTLAPVRSSPVLGLFSVMVKVLAPPGVIGLGENAFATVGGLATVIEAIAVLPVPPLPEDTVTLLFLTPAVVAMIVACT